MYKAILIDWNVLLTAHDERVAGCLFQSGAGDSPAGVAQDLQSSRITEIFHHFECGNIGGEDMLQDLERLFGGILIPRRAFWIAYESVYARNEDVFRFLYEVIRSQALSMRIIAIGNIDPIRLEAAKRICAFPFHGIVASCDVRARKPDAPIFANAILAAECDADQCLSVDADETYLGEARRWGMTGIRADADLRAEILGTRIVHRS